MRAQCSGFVHFKYVWMVARCNQQSNQCRLCMQARYWEKPCASMILPRDCYDKYHVDNV